MDLPLSGKVQEWPAVGGSGFHRGGEPALQLPDRRRRGVGTGWARSRVLQPVVDGVQAGGVDARSGHRDHAQLPKLAFRRGQASITLRSRAPLTPDPPTVTMQTISSGWGQVSQRLAVRQFAGVETGDVSAEIEVGFGPFPVGGRSCPKEFGTMSAGLPTKIERSRRRG